MKNQGQKISLGSYLKNLREAQGISLKVISKNTKISLTNLSLLEADSYDKLPDQIYVAGYVKSYSKSVGIAPDEGLRLLDVAYQDRDDSRRFAPGGIPKREPEYQLPPVGEGRVELKKINLKTVLGMLGILGVLAVNWFIFRPFGIPGDGKKEKAAKGVAETTSGEEKTTVKSIDAETPLKKAYALDSPSPGQEQAQIPDIPSPRQIEDENQKKAKKKFFPMRRLLYSVDTSMDKNQIEKSIPGPIQNLMTSGMQNVYIRATESDSWMAYKSDSEPIKKFTLKKGNDVFFKGAEIRLFLANYRGVQIFLNKKLLKIISQTRHKSLVFPQENRTKYVIPLFVYYKSGKVETSEEYLKREIATEDILLR